MKIQTYQSSLVLKILLKGEVYRAKPSIAYKREYAALIDMLDLKCDCPVFGVIKGKKQVTYGKVSGAAKLTLNVPDGEVKLTEYSVWASFLYACKFSKPGNYKVLQADCAEISIREYNSLIENIKNQRSIEEYEYPQVILQEIKPQWLLKHKVSSSRFYDRDAANRIFNFFRK